MSISHLKDALPPFKMGILLHTCCAPCSAAIIEKIISLGTKPVIFYFNPNIFPVSEYEKRKVEVKKICDELGLRQIDGDYNRKRWLERVKNMEHLPERGARCLECFKFRMEESARTAHENGLEVFTSSLASSRWKSLEQIFEAGELAEKLFPNLNFWAQNWRKDGLSERRAEILKEKNFYNQTYCGCEFSVDKNLK